MWLVEGSLGNAPGAVLLHDHTLRGTFDLGRDARKVKALLRGFAIGHSGEDHNFKRVAIELSTETGNDARHVEVVAHVRLSDRDPQGDIWISAELIQARVDFTLIAE
jgi:hypothetical protein